VTKLVLATRNAAKLAELRRIVAPIAAVELLGLADLPAYDEVPETGATFADNALLKAREAVAHTGLPAAADDSGLTVAALNGMPGVLSARWSGGHRADRAREGSQQLSDDKANLALVLEQIGDVPDDRRQAAFVCAAALVLPDGTERVVHGQIDGVLLHAPRGTGGFGYDPIFQPHGESRTTAEMPAAEKDAISHRGKAFRELAKHIAELLG